MALPDYFHRSAVAAAQVLAGYDEATLAEQLNSVSVQIAIEESSSPEKDALADLTVRLLARLYPRLRITGCSADRTRYVKLARRINPNLELVRGNPDFGIAIGDAVIACANPVFVGSNGWDAYVSTVGQQSVGDSSNPLGAGAASCLAASEIFGQVFGVPERLSGPEVLSTLDLEARPTSSNINIENLDVGSVVLVGAGAIGNATSWALGKAPLRGEIHLVDHEEVELSNLQRYVLTDRQDADSPKVEIAEKFFSGGISAISHKERWDEFIARSGHKWSQVLVALDSAQGRRDVQAALPYWIANAWTQPGDLGVSVHPWTQEGGCLACLYLPAGELPGEDKIIGAALGLTTDFELLQIRRLLHANAPLPRDVFPQVSAHLGVGPEALEPFSDQPLRNLYFEGLCGGAVLPLSRLGRPTQEVHVPIAHQSALAGILLASRLAAFGMGGCRTGTEVTRIDILRPLQEYLTQPMAKDERGICICQDSTFRRAFERKYSTTD